MPQQNARIPVNTDGLTMIVTGWEAAVRNVATGELVTDRKTGQVIYRVYVTVILPGEVRPQMWAVKVVGEPQGIEPGQQAVFPGLMANEYEIEGRRGFGFRAESVAAAAALPRPAAKQAA